jgi:flagellar protein FlgJ
VVARFSRYADAAGSFLDHARLISTARRYLPAMVCADDPFEFAAQLKACGYSTNPAYASELAALITEYHLSQYDVSTSGGTR